jgi:acyl-CoA reductase-like NAD-dependent aldehyde dehydrogenase/alcohol dehydrogenase class IV
MMHFQLLLDGRLVESADGARGVSFDPGSGEPVAGYAQGKAEDAAAAVDCARRAFDHGPWPRLAPAERAERVMELAVLIQDNLPRLARIEALDSGGLASRTASDIYQGLRFVRKMARLSATSFPWREELPPGAPLFPGRNYLVREPVGVCAAIIPWNFPLLLALWKIAMALLTGNTLVLKPAPQTPLSALALGEILCASRIPAGVVNIVAGPGVELGQTLVAHPAVDRVAFTGSTAVGKRIAAAAAATVKRVSLELGGKSANLILPDADLDLAVDGALFAAFLHAGQMCESGSRLLVPEALRDEILDLLIPRVRAIRVGYQLDPATQMGPVIDPVRREAIEGHIAGGLRQGARLVAGGSRVRVPGFEAGCYLEPTVFTDVDPEMAIASEEIFGPVLAVLAYRDLDEAVALANRGRYGLAAGVWSRDLARAERVAGRLQAGTVWINDWHVFHDHGPFGGYKESGVGRELGRAGLESYTEVKHVHVGAEGDSRAKLGHRALRTLPPALGFEQAAGPRLISGPGAIARLHSEAAARSGRFLLVTDAGVAAAGLVDRLRQAFGDAIVAVFDAVPQDSGLAVVDAAAEAGRRAAVSGVVSLGGGSVIDTGKAVSIALGLGVRAVGVLGMNHLSGTRLCHIAVPTTAGTGSEVTDVAVLRHEGSGRKVYVLDPMVVPDLAVLDPLLTLGLPPRLTAATAMDTLTHAVEAFVSPKVNPLAEAYALQAIRLVGANLVRAVRQGDDIEARSALLNAAMLAGLAINTARVGLAHAMSHAVGARYGVAHGEGNAVLLPGVIRFNAADPAVAARYQRLARELGAAAEAPAGEGGDMAADQVEALRAAAGLPRTLGELGVPREGLAACAAIAAADVAVLTNPRRIADVGEIEAIFAQAWGA